MICRTNARKYFSAKPYPKVIKKINHLHSRGYYIKVFTARFMGRNNENAIKAKKQGYKRTFNQLATALVSQNTRSKRPRLQPGLKYTTSSS